MVLGPSSSEVKKRIREAVWRILEERRVATFPLPVKGRIPNFKGAEEAAELLCRSREYSEARVVKVNPDSPQRRVRERCLLDGKTLIMPTPRIREGFIILDPRKIPRSHVKQAATIRGAFQLGQKISPEKLPAVDLIVIGSVAVSREGDRIGKGEGYAELEYAILRTLGKVSEKTPIFTTIHPLQIVDKIPREPYDVTVDVIFTPSGEIETAGERSRPSGIIWELLPKEKIEEIPILAELRRMRR